jgi:hypothetical protein
LGATVVLHLCCLAGLAGPDLKVAVTLAVAPARHNPKICEPRRAAPKRFASTQVRVERREDA